MPGTIPEWIGEIDGQEDCDQMPMSPLRETN